MHVSQNETNAEFSKSQLSMAAAHVGEANRLLLGLEGPRAAGIRQILKQLVITIESLPVTGVQK